MLGALLLVARAARRARRRSSSGLDAARARAGDRAHLGAAAGHLHQRLRRRAGDREVVELEEVHVGRGVHDAQAAVEGERPRPGTARSSAATARPGRRRPRRCTPCARSTAASYSAWVMFDSKARARIGGTRRRRGRAAGTGSASSSRARSISADRALVGRVDVVRAVDERVHEDRDAGGSGGRTRSARRRPSAPCRACRCRRGSAPAGARRCARGRSRTCRPRRRRTAAGPRAARPGSSTGSRATARERIVAASELARVSRLLASPRSRPSSKRSSARGRKPRNE